MKKLFLFLTVFVFASCNEHNAISYLESTLGDVKSFEVDTVVTTEVPDTIICDTMIHISHIIPNIIKSDSENCVSKLIIDAAYIIEMKFPKHIAYNIEYTIENNYGTRICTSTEVEDVNGNYMLSNEYWDKYIMAPHNHLPITLLDTIEIDNDIVFDNDIYPSCWLPKDIIM